MQNVLCRPARGVSLAGLSIGLHGGDVRGLGTNLIKYIVTALVIMNYGAVFTTINQGFVNAGNWISNASGGNVLENWGTDLKNQLIRMVFRTFGEWLQAHLQGHR